MHHTLVDDVNMVIEIDSVTGHSFLCFATAWLRMMPNFCVTLSVPRSCSIFVIMMPSQRGSSSAISLINPFTAPPQTPPSSLSSWLTQWITGSATSAQRRYSGLQGSSLPKITVGVNPSNCCFMLLGHISLVGAPQLAEFQGDTGFTQMPSLRHQCPFRL